MGDDSKHVKGGGALALGALAVGGLIVWYVTQPKTAAPPAAPPSPVAYGAERDDKCRTCETAAPPSSFFFIGTYLDAKCSSQPVAHADVAACATVPRRDHAVKVMFSEPSAKHTTSEMADVRVSRYVGADEVGRMFRKQDGRCAPYTPAGLKIAPATCDGKKVCRAEDGNLACGACNTLPNGCPDYQGSRLFALLAE